MSAAAASAGVPTGNAFDKYGSSNPVVRRLMAGFERALDDLLTTAGPSSLLDIGCGEGVLTARWARRLTPSPVVGVDLADAKLETEWAARDTTENLSFRSMDAERLEFGDDAFELVAGIEVLEHVADPAAALMQMARVASRWVLVSVPREPLWRALNVGRGAYLRALGNTPGHVNHWSRAGFTRLLSAHGEIVRVRTPFPWTMLLVRVG